MSNSKQITNPLVQRLDRYLVFPMLARKKGWAYLFSWGHRFSGVLLVLYLGFHIYTLLLIQSPEVYDAQMSVYRAFPFNILAWLLALPVIFHALNGGRLILFESYGIRADNLLMRIVIGLSTVYLGGLGILMILQVRITVRELFWGPILLMSVLVCFLVSWQMAKSRAGFGWKMHRISGSLMFLLIPGHMLFMHVHPDMAHSSSMVINRMQLQMIKVIDILLAASVLFHGGYGLTSLLEEYLTSRLLRIHCIIVVWIIVLFLAYLAVRFVISV